MNRLLQTLPIRQLVMTILISLVFISMNASMFSSLYSDHKSFSIGDILTVQIAEQSRASSSSGTRTGRQMDNSFNVAQGQGPLSFIPLTGAGLSANNSFRGDANTTRDASLSSKMTVFIVDIDDNGNLVIEGRRVVNINGEDEITTLTGVVRSQDVGADNTIHSHSIADARISYSGKGPVNEGSRKGMISRFFSFIF